jgi:hypothetical protein
MVFRFLAHSLTPFGRRLRRAEEDKRKRNGKHNSKDKGEKATPGRFSIGSAP